MVSGNWKVTVMTSMRPIELRMSVHERDNVVTGTLNGENNYNVPIRNAILKGNEFSFDARIKIPFGMMNISPVLIINGTTLNGSVKTRFGTFPITGYK